MAGVKGRSGGHREGAGRPRVNPTPTEKQAPVTVAGPSVDMLEFLQSVALGHIEASQVQVRAAIAAVQYTHPKLGEMSKREAKKKAAEDQATSGSKFGPRGRPDLKVVSS